MKYELIIDDSKEESIVITVHNKTKLIEDIENLINKEEFILMGYLEDSIHPLDLDSIYVFYTIDSKVYAKTKDKDYLIRERVYKIEEYTRDSFVKINQGCIVNIKKILKFETSLGGSIKVVMKNGYSDYIARRELQNVKRRIGI